MRPRPEETYRKAVQAFREGDTTEALRLARQAETRCPAGSGCHWAARLLEAEVLLGERQLEAAARMLADAIPAEKQFDALRARRLMLLGGLQITRNRSDNAAGLLRQAREAAMEARANDVLMDAEQWEGQLLFSLRKFDQAEEVFRREREQAAGQRDPYHEARALNGLGMMRLKQSRYDEAIPWFERTMEAANRGGARKMSQAASLNLGICYARLGNFDPAIKSLQRTIDLTGATGLTTYRMNALGEMGSTYLLQREPRKALPYYQQAADLARTGSDKALWYDALSSALAELQDWDGAARSNEQARLHAETVAAKAFAEEHAAVIAGGRGDYQQACALYRKAIEEARDEVPVVLWESHAGLAGVYSKTGNYTRANREFAQTIEIIDRNVARLSRDDYKLTFFARLIEFYNGYVESLLAQKAFQRALDIADSSRARILFQRLALNAASGASAVRDYRAIARAWDSVALFYWLAPGRSCLWVVTPSQIHPPIELPPADQIRRWVDQYRAFIEQRVGDPMAVENEAGRRLYETLIAPAKAFIPHGAKVILFPDGPLHWLNFETLPVYGGPGVKPHYWIEDVRPVVAPSLGVLSRDRPPKPHVPDSLMIIGDPVSPGAEFPALAYASQEIETIRAKFPNARKEIFVKGDARPGVYREAEPDRFSLLHFSAHAVANEQSPLDSAIVLSPVKDNFKLYARDILNVPLRADLVTISACRSAGARSYSGEGLVGFAWAFLQAGARNVIAGLWDVTDSSTPAIMDVLYSEIQRGRSPADALRESKLRLIRSARTYRKPYYWGPFQVYVR